MRKRLTYLLIIGSFALLTACTPNLDDAGKSEPNSASSLNSTASGKSTAVQMADPEDEYMSAAKEEEADLTELPQPLIHERGTGSKKFELSTDDLQGVSGLQVYVNCTSAAEFRATFGTFYAGNCFPEGGSTGIIPVTEDAGTFTLKVPKNTEYWLLVVPTQGEL